MIRTDSVLLYLLVAVAVGHRANMVPSRCLALGPGPWHPPEPTARWRATRVLTLLDVPDSAANQMGGRVRWRKVRLEPYQLRGRAEQGADYAAYADSVWLWFAPAPDSLLLVRPSIESRGLKIEGRWQGDTLTGRGHTFSDYIPIPAVPEPVAVVYAVRYECGRRANRADAVAAVERMRQER